MPNTIEEEVAENRKDIGREFARQRDAPPARERVLFVSPVPVDIEVTAELYTRPVNDTLLVGHPDATNGIGQGRVGDHRGSWSKQETATTTLERDGRRAIAEALAGTDVTLASASVSGAGDHNVTLLDDGPAKTRARTASFRINETDDPVTDVDVTDSKGRTAVATSITAVTADASREVRLDTTLTVSSGAGSDAALTDKATVADAIKDGGATRAGGLAIGTDNTTPAAADASLGNEVLRKPGQREAKGSTVAVVAVADRGEPNTQPHDIVEFGLLNQNQDLVTRSVFDTEAKDNRIRLRLRGGINIR